MSDDSIPEDDIPTSARRADAGQQRPGRWLPVRPRIEARIERNAATGCWNWTGTMTGGRGSEYPGTIGVRGKPTLAHRAAYEEWREAIPEGMVIDHLCGNPRCVNPFHMEAVTNAENIARGNGVSVRNARKTHCPHGHEYTPENTLMVDRGRKRAARLCATCYPSRRNGELPTTEDV